MAGAWAISGNIYDGRFTPPYSSWVGIPCVLWILVCVPLQGRGGAFYGYLKIIWKDVRDNLTLRPSSDAGCEISSRGRWTGAAAGDYAVA